MILAKCDTCENYHVHPRQVASVRDAPVKISINKKVFHIPFSDLNIHTVQNEANESFGKTKIYHGKKKLTSHMLMKLINGNKTVRLTAK